MLVIAQDQHGQVLDAIENREGSRAEALMREHSRLAQRNLREALHGAQNHSLPGVQLIRRRA
jgi:GntR family transcriptional regulator of vanillate catabolism